jgi:hypothetical protein
VNGWQIFWLSFSAVGLGVEAVALARSTRNDTASEFVWYLRGKSLNTWRAFIVLAVMAWLTGHFAFGWWT